MTENEDLNRLKEEAKALGYKLVPIQKYIRLSPCICGRRYPDKWYRADWDGYGGQFYKCPNCERKGSVGKTEKAARLNWNELMESLKGEDKV